MIGKKKNKRNTELLEDEIVVNSKKFKKRKRRQEPIEEVEPPKSKKEIRRLKKEAKRREKILKKGKLPPPKYQFVWANSEEYDETQKEFISKVYKKELTTTRKYAARVQTQVIPKEPKVEEQPEKVPLEEVIEPQTDEEIRKDLDEFFLKNNQDLKVSSKAKKKRQKTRGKIRSFYKYKGKKFSTPSDFLEYIDKHPNQVEKVAQHVEDDEIFFEWLGKNSHHFTESVKEFRIFKKKFEN